MADDCCAFQYRICVQCGEPATHSAIVGCDHPDGYEEHTLWFCDQHYHYTKKLEEEGYHVSL